jgi:peptidyl-prolyl cis-trans isomerase B (cyclophilin B)
MIILHTTHGPISVELEVTEAPDTAANFLAYAEAGFYDGTLFHRVIPGFMIQGGGFTPGMRQKATRPPIRNEAANGLRNDVGTLAMARTSDPHSASSQFFINVANNAFLNYRSATPEGWGYCVFGRVTAGMEVVRAIEGVATTRSGMHQDVPADDVLIERVEITKQDASAGPTPA